MVLLATSNIFRVLFLVQITSKIIDKPSEESKFELRNNSLILVSNKSFPSADAAVSSIPFPFKFSTLTQLFPQSASQISFVPFDPRKLLSKYSYSSFELKISPYERDKAPSKVKWLWLRESILSCSRPDDPPAIHSI